MKSIKRLIDYKNAPALPRRLILVGVIAVLSVFTQISLGDTVFQEEPEFLEYVSRQTTFYAQEPYTLQWNEGRDHWQGVENYIVRVYYANKILSETQLSPSMPIQYQLNYPPMRAGLKAEVLLTIAAVTGGKTQKGVYKEKFLIFSREQPLIQKEPLENSKIGVLDRTQNKTLVTFLEDMHIPFHELNTLNNFSGRWIIASGLDFEKDYSLMDELYSQFQHGVSILILAPLKGRFSFPLYQQGGRFMLADDDVIKDKNKDWSLQTVLQEQRSVKVFFRETIVGEVVGFQVSSDGPGGRWLELTHKNNTMVFCGWDLAALYQRNPSATLLIRHMLWGE